MRRHLTSVTIRRGEAGPVESVSVEVGDAQETVRHLELRLGTRLVVRPLNPARLRHRGRLCLFSRPDEPRARVRFEDNGASGLVDFGDLDYAPAPGAEPIS